MINKKSLISVIIATKSRKTELKRCVFSVLAQTYKCIELIVVDNGNSSEVKEFTKSIGRKYGKDKIKYVVFTESNVPSVIRNYGLKFLSPKSKYVKWIDDDDALENKYAIEKLVVYAKKTNALFSYGTCKYINMKGETIKYAPYKHQSVLDILVSGSFPCSSLLYSREIFKEVNGMPENLGSSEDIYLALEIIELAKKQQREIVFVDHVISIRKRNNKGVFYKNYFNGVKDAAMITLRKEFASLAIPLLPRSLGFLLLQSLTKIRRILLITLDNLGYTTEHIIVKREYYFEPCTTMIT